MKKDYVKPSAEMVRFDLADRIMDIWTPGTEEGTSGNWDNGFVDD